MSHKLESKEFVEVTGTVKYQTDHAILLDDGDREVWLPKSQIEDPEEFENGEHYDAILVPQWLAKDKGLI